MNINITEPVTTVATNLAQRSVDGAIKEFDYVCCFNSYVQRFEKEQARLWAKQKGVERDIDDAKRRNENRIKDEVQQWRDKANDLINIKDAKTKKKWCFGWCPNFIWLRRRGKELARKTLEITEHTERCNFNRLARPTELPGMKYYYSQNFIDFESRISVSKRLMEALEDGSCYMIGLQGMGGAGKTTLATQVGNKVEESRIFEKVLFIVVSNPPDLNKIRGDIARQLGLPLEGGKEAEHSKLLWSRISNNEGRVLIILDDAWEELNIRDIGIPFGPDHKNCVVLITTRDLKVCKDMGCHLTIQLSKLSDDDAMNLFLEHVVVIDDDFSSEMNDVAQKIVKECGGLPVAIVALARTLKNWPLGDWKTALTSLQNSEPLLGVHEDLKQVYRSLKLSYDNLKNDRAKELFLLCSLFPEDYEIPIELLSKLAIGMGLFGEVDKYYAARSQMLGVKNELIDSSLLLKGEKECLKMHDLIREVALWIANKGIQTIMDSKPFSKAKLQYLFWSTDEFPNQFDGTEIEILLLSIYAKGSVEVANAFFAKMVKLRVLSLTCNYRFKFTSASSLSQSLQTLKDILRTLILTNWKLDDISTLGYLQSLETLELEHCSIHELPKEIEKLKKLRLLGLRKCRIERNNPFEVIEKCSQLEELYFVQNGIHHDWRRPQDEMSQHKDEASPQNTSPPDLRRYYVAANDLLDLEWDGPISRLFNPKGIKDLISEGTFKLLVGRAEILELGNIEATGWTNLIPDIINPIKDGDMNDLIKLSLNCLEDVECLIDTRRLHTTNSNVYVFRKLGELCLHKVDVKDLYHGPMPLGFLSQLKFLKLTSCLKLDSMLFNGNFNLCHLKIMELKDCPMLTSIFQSSTTPSLVQLEVLIIKQCGELEYIIEDIESQGQEIVDNNDLHHTRGSLFPKLETLEIAGCDKLEYILPTLNAGDLPCLKSLSIRHCGELKYIVGECRDSKQGLHQNTDVIMFPSLEAIQLEGLPSLVSIFRESHISMPSSLQKPSQILRDAVHASSGPRLCCFLPTTINTHDVVSKATIQDHTISQQELWIPSSQCLLRRSLNLKNTRKIKVVMCSNLVSLFTLSINTTMLLEELVIHDCHGLKNIITMEEEEHHHHHTHNTNHTSIFPRLETLDIFNCSKLEFIFPNTFIGGLEKLRYVVIRRAPELKYVFGKFHHEDYLSSNNELLNIDLPALQYLCLLGLPKIISICTKKYYLMCPSVQRVVLQSCLDLNVRSFYSLMGHSQEDQLNLETTKEPQAGRAQNFNATQSLVRQPLNMNVQNIREMEFKECSNLISLFTLPIASKINVLECLTVEKCYNLKCIIAEDQGDSQDFLNYKSIFPNLKELKVLECQALESLFPAHFLRYHKHLTSLSITSAPKMKFVFGRSHHQDFLSHQNQDYVNTQLDLPALGSILLEDIPNLVSICPINYYVTSLSLNSIVLKRSPQFFPRSFTDYMVCRHERRGIHNHIKVIQMRMQNLTRVDVDNFKIEEIFDLEGLAIKRPVQYGLEYMRLQSLSELRHIFKGPKNIMTLYNLRRLYITECKKLRAIFSASTLRSLPQLSTLEIINCEELEHIIEEDYEENIANNGYLDQLCFPQLYSVCIKCCNNLKILFSITTCGMLPKLCYLTIEEANELEHVFIRQEGDMQKKVVEDVFPVLDTIQLKKLPKLITICEGIDFKPVKTRLVLDCPKIDQGTTQLQEDPEKQASTEELLFAHSNTDHVLQEMGGANLTQAIEESSMGISVEGPTQTFEKQTLQSSLTESYLRRRFVHDMMEKGSRIEATIAHKQALAKSGKESIPDSTTLMKAKIVTSLINSQLGDSKAGPSRPVTQSIKERIEQGLQEHDATEGCILATPSTNSASRNQYIGSLVNSLDKKSMQEAAKNIDKSDSASRIISTPFDSKLTVKETRDESIQAGPKSGKATEANLSTYNWKYSLDISKDNMVHESQIGPATPTRDVSPILGIGEIFQLVELKDG